MTAMVVARRSPLRRWLVLLLAGSFAAGALLFAVLRHGVPLLPAAVTVPLVVVIPWWVWTLGLLLPAIYVGWLIYRDQAVLEQLDKATEDSDFAARAVHRHNEQLREITERLDELATRPTPYRRATPEPTYGRHAAS